MTMQGLGESFDERTAELTRNLDSHAGSNNPILLTAAWINTPLGPMLAVASDDGLVLLDFWDRKGMTTALNRLRERFAEPGRTVSIVLGNHRHLAVVERELTEYFESNRQTFTVAVCPRGTAFEQRAWDSLRQIPFGQTRSYGEQAKEMQTTAVRAVGRANGMNFISVVIPCHRVIAGDGKLTGYGGGLDRKRWLLDHERNRSTTRPQTVFENNCLFGLV